MGEYADRVQAGFEAFNRHDLDGLAEMTAPDVEWTPPAELPGSRTYLGHDGVRDAVGDLLEIFPDLQAEPFRIVEEGTRVIGFYRWIFSAPGGASADPLEIRAGMIIDFDDDALVKTARFWSTWEETEATAEKERARQEAGPSS